MPGKEANNYLKVGKKSKNPLFYWQESGIEATLESKKFGKLASEFFICYQHYAQFGYSFMLF